jgi:hypothetical protein
MEVACRKRALELRLGICEVRVFSVELVCFKVLSRITKPAVQIWNNLEEVEVGSWKSVTEDRQRVQGT